MKELRFSSTDKLGHTLGDVVDRLSKNDRLGLMVLYSMTMEDAEAFYERMKPIVRHVSPYEGLFLAEKIIRRDGEVTLSKFLSELEVRAMTVAYKAWLDQDKEDDTDSEGNVSN